VLFRSEAFVEAFSFTLTTFGHCYNGKAAFSIVFRCSAIALFVVILSSQIQSGAHVPV